MLQLVPLTRRSHLDFGMVSFGLHVARTEEEVEQFLRRVEGPNHLSFVLAGDGRLHFVATGTSGPPQTGVVEPGEPLATGWTGIGITVDRFYPRAIARREVEPAPPPK